MEDSSRTYFAAARTSEIGSRLVGRLKKATAEENTERLDLLSSAYEHYYGRDVGQGETTRVLRGGEQGELAQIRIGRARALAKAYLALVTSGKVSWRPTARNGDAGAAAATSLASNVLDDFWKARRFSQQWLWWVEQAIAFTEAYLFPEWDLSKGPALAPTKHGLAMQGDITVHNVLPWDVVVDEALTSAQSVQWRYTRLYKNRWDVAALAAISGVVTDGKRGDDARDLVLQSADAKELGELGRKRLDSRKSEDLVAVWYFHHQPSAALPQGREVVFISEQCVLHDGILGYDAPGPVYRLSADEQFDTPHGWSQFLETLGAQEISDGIETTLASIITNLGHTCVAIEKGTEERPQKLPSGYRPWVYPKGGAKPESVQLAEFPADALKYREALASDQNRIMGLNDVALGQPQSAQMNAQAFAVLVSMAVQQAGPFQAQAMDSLAKVGTGILKTLAKRVTHKREVRVVGKSSESLYTVQKYVGEDLDPASDVVIDIGNPMEQSPAGRMQLLQLFQSVPGAITSVEDIVQVVETGRLEPATRRDRDESLLVMAEYEMLQQGKQPAVHTGQNHALHYRENYAVLLSPAALQNKAVIDVVQAHLDAHYLEYYGVPPLGDPLRLPRQRFLLGQGPEPMPMMPPPMPGAEAAPVADGGQAQGPPGGVGMTGPAPLGDVAPPSLPPNPVNGSTLSLESPPVAAAPAGGLA